MGAQLIGAYCSPRVIGQGDDSSKLKSLSFSLLLTFFRLRPARGDEKRKRQREDNKGRKEKKKQWKKGFTMQFENILDFVVGGTSDENHLNLTRLRQMGHPCRLVFFIFSILLWSSCSTALVAQTNISISRLRLSSQSFRENVCDHF